MQAQVYFHERDGMPEVSFEIESNDGVHWINIVVKCQRTTTTLAKMTFFGSPDYLRDLAANIEKAALIATEAAEDMAEAEAYHREKMAELAEEGREETLAGIDG